MTGATGARNFDCVAGDDPGPGHCEFHPVFERVNVLPDRFEFVLAGDATSSSDPEEAKQVLYDQLPTVAEAAKMNLSVFCTAAPEIGHGSTVVWEAK